MKETRNRLKKIIQYFGADKQIDIALEEMSELTKALLKDRRGKGDKKEIIDEIADVQIMVAQLIEIYNIPQAKVNERVEFKIDRTEKIISDMKKADTRL